MKYTTIYYFQGIQTIGGIETFFYELAKKYGDRDLTIFYKYADMNQLKRLRKYVRCIQYKGQKIECERAFFNFNLDIIDNVDAKEYCLVVHGNYKMLKGKPPTNPKINKVYAVSKDSAEAYTELTGIPCEVTYNPISLTEPKKIVHLCSANRLDDPVKGANRTKALIKALDDYCEKTGNRYLWTIFTKNVSDISSLNVAIMKPRLDVNNYMADADYIVQLSDNFEGYNYTLNEALLNKVPFVATPCNVYKELGMNETMGIWLDFDLNNLDEVVKQIFQKVGTFKINYKSPKDGWDKLIIDKKSTYKEELKMKIKVKCLINFNDVEENVNRKIGDEFICDKIRADYLLEHKAVEFLEEIKEKAKIEKHNSINIDGKETKQKRKK